MPGSSNTSFIPKRNPALKDKSTGKRQVYVGTVVVRILFVAVVIATLGVFFYERYLENTLDAEVVALSNAIGSFNEAEMQRVLAVEKRIAQAQYRLDHSASMIGLFRAIEAATVGSAKIKALTMERLSDTQFEVVSEIETASFDSVLFQRDILENSEALVVEEINEIRLDNPPPEDAIFDSERVTREDGVEGVIIGFQALLSVTTDTIPHTVGAGAVPAAGLVPVVVPETASSSAQSEADAPETLPGNEEII